MTDKLKCVFLKDFTYCPKCGEAFVDNNIKSKRCEKCQFVYYFNPSSAVVAIIRNQTNEILVCIRAKEPAKGTFDLPGGFVDPNETAEEAVCREISEETNLEIVSMRYIFSLPNIYKYSDFDVHTLDMFFECEVSNFDNIKAADDVTDIKFIRIEDLEIERFGLASIRKGLKRYFR